MNEIHVAVIGSGIGGLSVALDLCNNGIRPVIFEKNAMHGGYATNFQRDGFRFEVSLHYVSPLFRVVLDRLGISRDVDLIDLKKSAFVKCDEQEKACGISKFEFNDKGLSYVQYLISKYPGEEKSIRKLFSLGTEMLPMSDDLIINRTNPFAAMLKHPRSIPSTFKYIGKTSKNLLDELFVDENLKQEVSALAIILGTPLDVMAAVPYIQTATESYERGGFYIHGGSQHLVDVMRKRIEQLGGIFYMNSPVNKMKLSTDGMVESILARSKSFDVDSVIYCCDMSRLVNTIIPQATLFKKEVRSLPVASAASVVHLGLGIDVKNEYGLDGGDYAIKTPEMAFNIAIYSNVDPSCCKRGNSVITLTGLGYDDFERRSMKELNRVLPGIKKHVIVKEYMTPLDFENLTWNAGGSFGGFQTTPLQMRSPVPHETLVKNLFVAGQWTGVGAGYINTMLGGIETARLYSKKMNE